MTTVSVVIPVYNQQTYIAEAIDSVLAQSFKDYETIVVDDGSTDGTSEILARYGKAITSVRQPNRGGAAALNTGIRHARGEWIGWLSSDDVWEPRKLERQMTAAADHPEIALIYSDCLVIDAKGDVLRRKAAVPSADRTTNVRRLLRTCYINGSTVVVRSDVFDAIGYFDETDRISPDYDMWLRIAERYDILYVPEALCRYRVHPSQISAKGEALQRASKHVVSRWLRRVGALEGTRGALIWIGDEIRSLPWMIRPEGGGYPVSRRVRALLDTLRILIDPRSPDAT